MKARTVLGFDYGTKRIGVAVGQEVTRTARPFTTLLYSATNPVWPRIGQLLKEWQPDALIVGLPAHLDGTPHAMTAKAQDFIQQLQHHSGLPIYPVDERLTSFAAELEVGTARANKAQVDQVAAQIILQAWLNQPSEVV